MGKLGHASAIIRKKQRNETGGNNNKVAWG